MTWEYSYEGTNEKTAMTGTKVGPEFTRRFPETEAFVRLMKYPRVLATEHQMFEEKNFVYADSAFFGMFSSPLKKGNPATALDGPNKIVLTEGIAEKYFGNEDPVGKTIKVGGTTEFLVTGVAEDPPLNSQIQFDMLGSFSSLNASKEEKWSEANYFTYLLLQNKDAIAPLQKKIEAFMKEVNAEDPGFKMAYHLEPMSKVHLHSDLDGLEPNSSMVYIYVLSAVALLILLIACVNYTNLSTAQAAGRSAEIGMRKVMGAGKKDIFVQFISEAFLLALTAVVAAVFIAYLLMPYFNELSGKAFPPEILYKPTTLLLLLGLAVIVAFLAGTYPALVLSSGRVIKILKTGFTFTGSAGLRRGLIVFQFVFSIFLFISTIVILQQLDYIQTKDLGYNKDQVLILPVDSQIRENYDAIRAAIENVPGVISVAGAYEEPTNIGWSDALTSGQNGQVLSINALPVDPNFIKTLDLQIIAGNELLLNYKRIKSSAGNDDTFKPSYILNETAVKAFGWTPEEAIGKKVQKGMVGEVGAVIKDFHFRSLHEPIGPLVMFIDPSLVRSMFIKFSPENMTMTLMGLKSVWQQRVPHRPFEYQFLDENYTTLYKAEQSIAGVFTAFATVAILLACLGLFTLTAYAIVRRTKEIGIRKVLGATVTDILTMVSTDFVKLVLVAVVIAIPLSIFAVNKWLETFSYRIDLQWWVIILASIITLAIATVTVCLQAFKTAVSNPVKNLKTD